MRPSSGPESSCLLYTSFEQWNQNQGIAVYSATVPAGPSETLEFANVNDYSQGYLNGEPVGTLDRRLGQKSVELPERKKPGTLEFLVEAMGHIKFHISMESDRKGLHGPVKLGTRELKNWTVRALPLKADSIVPVSYTHLGKVPVQAGTETACPADRQAVSYLPQTA